MYPMSTRDRMKNMPAKTVVTMMVVFSLRSTAAAKDTQCGAWRSGMVSPQGPGPMKYPFLLRKIALFSSPPCSQLDKLFFRAVRSNVMLSTVESLAL